MNLLYLTVVCIPYINHTRIKTKLIDKKSSKIALIYKIKQFSKSNIIFFRNNIHVNVIKTQEDKVAPLI